MLAPRTATGTTTTTSGTTTTTTTAAAAAATAAGCTLRTTTTTTTTGTTAAAFCTPTQRTCEGGDAAEQRGWVTGTQAVVAPVPLHSSTQLQYGAQRLRHRFLHLGVCTRGVVPRATEDGGHRRLLPRPGPRARARARARRKLEPR